MGESLKPPRCKQAERSGNHQISSFSADAEEGLQIALLTPEQLEAWSHTKCFNEAMRSDDRTDKQISRECGVSTAQISKLRAVLWEERARQAEAIIGSVRHAGFVQKILWDFDLVVVPKKRPRRPPLRAPRRQHND